MQQGMATVMFFLQLYFHDMVPLPEGMRAEEAVSYALLPLLVSAALASVVSGHVCLVHANSMQSCRLRL
eukprot:m.292363 g.292363  ORF g.292363 m.292363 type:complete len:69 (-) comp15838_c2_seq3:655-861(-)